MSYLLLKPKSKKEEAFLKSLIEKLDVEYTKVSLEDYIKEIAESRRQFGKGKKVSLSSLANGL
jgi:hypothetical protein